MYNDKTDSVTSHINLSVFVGPFVGFCQYLVCAS